MISVKDAYKNAKAYFATNLGKDNIAKATMNESAWFFISGEPNKELVGNVVISIDKRNGKIAVIDILSDEGFELIKATTPFGLPC